MRRNNKYSLTKKEGTIMRRNRNGYTINYAKNTIVITRDFGKKASVYGSAEYDMLKALRQENPKFTVAYKTVKEKENKKTHKGLTFDLMELYIEILHNEYLSQFEAVKEFASTKNGKYAITKKWFLEKFPNYLREMKDAKAEEMKKAFAAISASAEETEAA